MPRYFFDIDDGHHRSQDDEGLDLDDLIAARKEAMRALSDLARDDLLNDDQRNLVIIVRTDDGRPIFRAALSLNMAWLG